MLENLLIEFCINDELCLILSTDPDMSHCGRTPPVKAGPQGRKIVMHNRLGDESKNAMQFPQIETWRRRYHHAMASL